MTTETVQIVSALLCVLLVIALVLRRKAKGKKGPSDGL
jgi:hypothetical protein